LITDVYVSIIDIYEYLYCLDGEIFESLQIIIKFKHNLQSKITVNLRSCKSMY